MLENAGDFIIDIPRLWDYLAEMVEPILQEGIIDSNFLDPIQLYISKKRV